MPNISILGSFGDLSASQIAGAASQLVPSGVVMAFAGATAPSGWLLCNGSLINRTTYSNLFTAIGTAHGSGDGSTTFALPNYAGQFLRGRANGSANDPDRASRTAAATGGNTGDAVGSVQGNATAKNGLGVTNNAVTTGTESATHTHSGTTDNDSGGPIRSGGTSVGNGGTLAAYVNYGNHTHTFSTGGQSVNHTHSVTSNVTLGNGDNESRPRNAYVNYIIKI